MNNPKTTQLEITQQERTYLRELARTYIEYANKPIMEERKKIWYAHNGCRSERPVIVMEERTFAEDFLPKSTCTNPFAQEMEKTLLLWILNYELVGDDKVIPPFYQLPYIIDVREFGFDIRRTYASDSHDRSIGYTEDHPIKDLERDFSILRPYDFFFDENLNRERKQIAEDVLGDIMPVEGVTISLNWFLTPSENANRLMGTAGFMMALLDYPEKVKELYRYLTDEMVRFLRWLEEKKLLTLNNEYAYAGAGSYGFTTELPRSDDSSRITSRDLWGNVNSQETVSISPQTYKELVFPAYVRLAGEFGLVYYGCCEPVHDIWDDCVGTLPNLRKVSISPWCDEEIMGEKLNGSGVIYSRKPKPNFIGVGELDEEEFRNHITKTLKSARGCTLEFIYRDVYSLNGDHGKPGKAVRIIRELIDEQWR